MLPNPQQICNEYLNKPEAKDAAIQCQILTQLLVKQVFNDYCLGTLSPYENFMMALKSKETKRQHIPHNYKSYSIILVIPYGFAM